MAATSENVPTNVLASETLNTEAGGAAYNETEELGGAQIDTHSMIDHHISPNIFRKIHSTSRNIRLGAMVKIRRFLDSDASIQPVLDSGVLPTIIDMLSPEDPEFLLEATGSLVNITAGNLQQTSAVAEAGAIPKLVKLFPTSCDSSKEAILTTFGNMLVHAGYLRKLVIREGGLKLALDVLRAPEDHSAGCAEAAAWAVASAAKGEGAGFLDDDSESQTIAASIAFIRNQSDKSSKLFKETVKALVQISFYRDLTAEIIKSGITPQIVQLCAVEDNQLRENALRLVVHISAGSEDSVQALIDADCLTTLGAVIAERPRDRGIACSALANLARGTPRHARAFMESPLLPHLLQTLSDPIKALGCRAEVAQLMLRLAQTATSYPQLFDSMMEGRCIRTIPQGLRSQDSDELYTSLRALEQVLDAEWDGRQRAREQFHALHGPRRLRQVRANARREEVAKAARRILEAHFPELSKWPRV